MTARPLSFKIANFYIIKQYTGFSWPNDTQNRKCCDYISLHIREIDTEENIHNLYTHTSTKNHMIKTY